MKRTLFVLMLSLVTVVGMAQRHAGHGRGGHDPRGHHPGPEMHFVPCATPDQADLVLNAIEQESFDDKKLELAKLCVSLVPFEVRDLARMASKFSFDGNRKEFLIYAYENCCNQQDYYDLKDVFEFRSNFDEMMEAVRKK